MLAAHPTHDEEQYLDLVRDILAHGRLVEGRNGTTKSVIGAAMRFDLRNGVMPILTTKKVAYKTCLKELLWFISGSTDNAPTGAGVKIWMGMLRAYLDSIGMSEREENDLGPVYGHQWRYFNAPYTTRDDDYEGKGLTSWAPSLKHWKILRRASLAGL